SAVTSTVTAATLQRAAPAKAATTIAPAGRSVRTSQGPMSKNTTTSAATEIDQRRLVVIGDSPAALQRITEKVSCMAWLPSTSAATSTTRRTTTLPSNVGRVSRVTSSPADERLNR